MKQQKFSRSKVDLFIQCPRCFYLESVKGIKRPPGFPFNLNSAVDALLKREFDLHRAAGTPHPLQVQFGINAVPAPHQMMDIWRHNFTGVQFMDTVRSVLWYGAIDDLWVDPQEVYYVVDYKATAKAEPVTELADWTSGYKRQMEFYQWLLRKNGLQVSDTGYFVYCTGNNMYPVFENTLHFSTHVIPYTGSDDWIEPCLDRLCSVFNDATIPDKADDCEYCRFAVDQHKVV